MNLLFLMLACFVGSPKTSTTKKMWNRSKETLTLNIKDEEEVEVEKVCVALMINKQKPSNIIHKRSFEQDKEARRYAITINLIHSKRSSSVLDIEY